MERRVKKLLRLIGDKTDGVLITSAENVRYLSGFTGSEGILLVTHSQSFFFTDGRYTTQARQQVQGFSLQCFRDKWKDIGSIIKKLGIRTLGFESRHLTVAMLGDIEKQISHLALKLFGAELDGLRLIKDSGEIALLRKAARIAHNALQEVLPLIVPGVSEHDIATELEYRMKQHGAQGPAFPTIVASGVRSALPHGTATEKKICAGELLTIDYGVQYQGYCSDETCTFVVGKPTRRQKRVYETVLRAHDRALQMVAPNIDLKKIDAAARSLIARHGFQRYFNHGTGHGVGLCVHEPPVVSARATMTARRGMVFTIEPGVYIPGWGGVRIEDMVLVTARVYEVLTCHTKKLHCLAV